MQQEQNKKRRKGKITGPL